MDIDQRWPRTIATAAISVMVLILAGCGGGDSTEAEADGTVVEHVYGETRLDGKAERVVSLTAPFTDALIAIGVDPVATGVDPLAGGELLPWQQDLAGETELIELDADYSIPVERIASYEPDLILAGPLVTDEEVYDQLSSIAPTVPALSSDGFVDSWQEQTLLVGDATGKTAEAEAAVEDSEATVEAARQKYPELEGHDYTFLAFVDPTNIAVVNEPEDTAAVFFEQLGLTLSDAAQAVPSQGVQGAISPEEIDSVDADLLFVTYFAEDDRETVEAGGLFQNLESVQQDRYFAGTLLHGMALRSPTVLNGEWLLAELEPFLSSVEF